MIQQVSASHITPSTMSNKANNVAFNGVLDWLDKIFDSGPDGSKLNEKTVDTVSKALYKMASTGTDKLRGFENTEETYITVTPGKGGINLELENRGTGKFKEKFGDVKKVVISTTYDKVVWYSGCANFMIKDITPGHFDEIIQKYVTIATKQGRI